MSYETREQQDRRSPVTFNPFLFLPGRTYVEVGDDISILCPMKPENNKIDVVLLDVPVPVLENNIEQFHLFNGCTRTNAACSKDRQGYRAVWTAGGLHVTFTLDREIGGVKCSEFGGHRRDIVVRTWSFVYNASDSDSEGK